MDLLVLLAFLCLLIGSQYVLLSWYEHNQKTTWRLAAEGEFEHAMPKSALIRAPRYAGFGLVSITTIFFRDGKTCPIRGVIHNPPAPGTKLRVLRNGLGDSIIEIQPHSAAF